jgi:hypothetical protein
MPRYNLYTYTEAQAEAMSAEKAAELLAKQKEMDDDGGDYGEAWNRKLSDYAGPEGFSPDLKEGRKLWAFWSREDPEKAKTMDVSEAFSLLPEVKKILQGKAAGGRRRKSRKSRKSRTRGTRRR